MNEEIKARKILCQLKEQFKDIPFNLTLKISDIKDLDKAFTTQ